MIPLGDAKLAAEMLEIAKMAPSQTVSRDEFISLCVAEGKTAAQAELQAKINIALRSETFIGGKLLCIGDSMKTRADDAGPNGVVHAPSPLVEDVLGLLEKASCPTATNDQIVALIEGWEKTQPAKGEWNSDV